jgi:hypothetical protein
MPLKDEVHKQFLVEVETVNVVTKSKAEPMLDGLSLFFSLSKTGILTVRMVFDVVTGRIPKITPGYTELLIWFWVLRMVSDEIVFHTGLSLFVNFAEH